MSPADAMNDVLAAVERATGKPVVVEADDTLRLHASMVVARGQAPVHVVRYRAKFEPERPYLVSYQCGFILRQAQAGPDRQFDLEATHGGRAEIENLLRYHFSRRKRTLPDHVIRGLRDQLYDGLGHQLRSIGPGLRVDAWIADRYPPLRPAQRAAVVRQLNENAQGLRPEVRDLAPHRVFTATMGMNAAFALFFARLWGDPLVAEPYRTAGLLLAGEDLLRQFDEIPADAGHDRDLVAAWGQALRLGEWFAVAPKCP